MKTPAVLTESAAMRRRSLAERAAGKSVGLVPTMGALHEGHLSLMRRSRAEDGFVAASIFVNPAQFGPGEDLESYPRDLDRDLELCAGAGVDAVFAPSAGEMYPEDFSLSVDPGVVAGPLEGASRPNHFRGVATVVAKLFNIVLPDRAYFGQKDAQQLAVIRNLVRGLNFGVEVVACPTVRESDGLAMSSRNAYLNPGERQAAPCLFRALGVAKDLVAGGERSATKVAAAMAEEIVAEPLAELDYAAVVDPDRFEDVEKLNRPVLALLAVRIGNTRLIDNLLLEPAGKTGKKRI
jgi:pantoate--beta-alanine ligase